MKRSLKNMIMIGIIILMVIAIYFTLNMNNNVQSMGATPPEMPGSSDSTNTGDIPGNRIPFNMPNENGSGNENQYRQYDGDRMMPPSMPDESDSSGNKNSNTPPEMPSGSMNLPSMPSSSSTNGTTMYILLGVETFVISTVVVYLLMSKFNKKTFKETYQDKDKLIITGLLVIILTGGMTYLCSTFKGSSTNSNASSGMPNASPGGNSGSIAYSATKAITSSEDITSGEYTSTTALENVISASGKITSNISNISVNKTGDSDGGDNTSFYGTNSAIIAKDGTNLTIKNVEITTDATGANGVFSYGGSATTNNSGSDGTTINISDSTITTSKDNSGGIMTTGGGVMNATNLTINTSGISSAAIRSDRGGGTVNVSGGTYKTTGKGSPAIYSTADITVKNATLIATKSEGAIIEGKNSITLENVELTDTNNELNGQSTTYKNVFLYQSMSGDAATGEAVFTAKNSTITTNKGDSFYVTNTTATINLENNTIVNNDSDGNFLKIKADSWGNSGSNGGVVTLNLTSQEVDGNIYVDSISTLTMNMTKSNFVGAINTDNTAKEITLKLDSTSKIKLTANSYVTSLEDEDTTYSNIDFNGFKLYVNGKAIN